MENVYVIAEKPSIRRTLVIQVALCLALYAAFHIGTPQLPSSGAIQLARRPADLFFVSVRGGVRTPREQSQLLQQMGKVAKTYKAKFVVDISELGEHDPLLQNATLHFPSEIPWYATTVSGDQMTGNFVKTIKLPYEQTLDIISVDTRSLQEVLFPQEQLNKTGDDILNWLQRILATSNSNWRIVIGFDPLIVYDEEEGTGIIKFNKPLHNIFLESGVDAYLSKQGSAGYFYHNEGITYMENPGPSDNLDRSLPINVNPDVFSEMRNGFLLHRVSPLEIESSFIDSTEIQHKRKKGKLFYFQLEEDQKHQMLSLSETYLKRGSSERKPGDSSAASRSARPLCPLPWGSA
ncbi:hypothetical protein Cni_G28185 [Canna indica]|uniref:Uncharacterized protein n=1 Tax=Canna indica TaxID=4628 RepID=A0AAQ3L550_9LILI|nr:hypothetical protein Cni_G28185 [Canna indica]